MAMDYEGKTLQAIQDAQKGSRPAMEHCLGLIEYPLKGLVNSYGKFSDRYGSPVDQQELYNEAIVYILESFGKFKPNAHKSDEGVRKQFVGYFLTIVKPKIRRACQEATRTVSLPDWAVKFGPRIQKAIEQIAEEQGSSFSYGRLEPEDVASRCGAPLSRVRLYLKKQLGRHSASMFTNWDDVVESCVEGRISPSPAGEAETFDGHRTTSNTSEVEQVAISDETRKLISRSWKFLGEHQKQVLSLRYGLNSSPMTRQDIASQLGMTMSQVRCAEAEALDVIRETLEGGARAAAGT